MKHVNWSALLKLTNQNEILAKEIFTLFLEELPKKREEINSAYSLKDFTLLSHTIHQLLGACSYCATEQLIIWLNELETALKNKNHQPIAALVDEINHEIDYLCTNQPIMSV